MGIGDDDDCLSILALTLLIYLAIGLIVKLIG